MKESFKALPKHHQNIILVLGFFVFLIIFSVIWREILAEETAPPTVPAAPSGLTYGTITSSSVSLMWIDNATNEDRYTVQRKLSSASWSDMVSSVTSFLISQANVTSYTDTTVTAGETYDYRVIACLTGTGCSEYSTLAGVSVPTAGGGGGGVSGASCTGLNLTLNNGTTIYVVGESVSYTWTCTPGGTASNVSIWLEKPDHTSTLYNSGSGSSTLTMGFSTSNLTPGAYILKACFDTACATTNASQAFSVALTSSGRTNGSSGGGGGTSSNGTSPGGIPASPTGLELSSETTPSSVPIKWTDNSSNEDSFIVERKLTSGITFMTIGQTALNIATYTDTSMTPGFYYDYRVKACYQTNCSNYAYSQAISVPVTGFGFNTPNTPTNLALNGKVVSGSVPLRWMDNSSNEDGFKIERKLSTATIFAFIYQVGANIINYIDTTATAGSTYDYRVQACLSGVDCSNYSTLAGIPVTTIPTDPITTGGATSGSGDCTGLILTLKNGKNIYTLGESVNYTWTCSPGGIADNVSIWLQKPDGTSVNYNYGSGSGSQTMGFSTSNLTPGAYILKACFDTACATVNASQPFTVTTATITNDVADTATNDAATTTPAPTETNLHNAAARDASATSNIANSSTSSTDITNAVTTTTATTSTIISSVEFPTEEVTTSDISNTINALSPSAGSEPGASKEKIIDLLYKDSNKDGISDYDSVYVYNMNPAKPSPVSVYQGKKVNASEKILLGFDPTKSKIVEVKKEQPAESSATIIPSYKVKEIALTEKKEIIIKGQALPNSFITVYVYSTPVMVTVKADKRGEWQYTLDKELENGDHTIYTATVNNTGSIIAKSAGYLFTKTAEAVTVRDLPAAGVYTGTKKPGLFDNNNIFIIIGSVSLALLIILTIIGITQKKHS